MLFIKLSACFSVLVGSLTAGEDGLVNYIERRDKIRCASGVFCLHLDIVFS